MKFFDQSEFEIELEQLQSLTGQDRSQSHDLTVWVETGHSIITF
jgi:hypothetical protein